MSHYTIHKILLTENEKCVITISYNKNKNDIDTEINLWSSNTLKPLQTFHIDGKVNCLKYFNTNQMIILKENNSNCNNTFHIFNMNEKFVCLLFYYPKKTY